MRIRYAPHPTSEKIRYVQQIKDTGDGEYTEYGWCCSDGRFQPLPTGVVILHGAVENTEVSLAEALYVFRVTVRKGVAA